MWDRFRLNGSEEALSLIYYEYFDFLYDFALKYTSDESLIEDCIQNMFSYLLKKQKMLNPVSNPRFYLLQAFKHELLHQLQKTQRVIFQEDIAKIPEQVVFNHAEDDMEQEEREHILQLVQKSIRKLGPKQQEIIYLRFNQGLDYPEISEMLKLSPDSCYKSIYRSIKFIQEDIEKVIGNKSNLLLWVYVGIKKNSF